MSPSNRRRSYAFPGLLLAIACLGVPGLALAQGTGTSRSFDVGSLIIPVDNCYQGDVAQPTPPKELSTVGAWGSSACAGDQNSNSVMANGSRRAYGLIWMLLKAGVPIYWIVDNAKTAVDQPDLTIGSCGNGKDVVTLVDPSLPASYCGLDSLHPVEASSAVSSIPGFPGACKDPQTGGSTPGGRLTVGTVPLRSDGTAVTTISYRGGPFVIDSKDASLARDVMAWYFAPPPFAQNGAGPTLPIAAGNYVTPASLPAASSIDGVKRPYTNVWVWGDLAGTLGNFGNLNQYVDPGHHPLHWSDYTPSVMVPFYPALAFGLDIGSHSTIWPCNDACLCPYTTWDPLNPNGLVDPWAGTVANGFTAGSFNGPDSQNAITYATVNVHQAQVGFEGKVSKVFDAPMNPVALAAMGDPVHINTFRFYIEEAGLTFGPCKAPPAPWLGASSTGFANFNPNDPPGQPAGYGDRFFDPLNYPFPSNGPPGGVATWSQQWVTCSEGFNADPSNANDWANMSQINANANQGSSPAPCSPPMAACSPYTNLTPPPYGQVLDLIAPEPLPIQSLLSVDSAGNAGCGAPTYQELWIPHWDAYLCSGPTTEGCPLAAQSTASAGMASGAWTALSASLPAVSPYWATACSAMVTGADGYDPYCPQLVQTFFNAVQTYVWKGGNLLAECLGASSLEDFTYERYLGEKGVSQKITHFMSEWTATGNTNNYWPTQAYFASVPPLGNGGLTEPLTYGNGAAGANKDCIEVAAQPCDGIPGATPGRPTDKIPGNLCLANTAPLAVGVELPQSVEAPAGLAVGWPGDQVQVGPIAGANNTVQLVTDALGQETLQFNGFAASTSQNPMPQPGGLVNSLLCKACNWGQPGICPASPGNTCAGSCDCQTVCTCTPTGAQDPLHAVYYAPPASIVGAGANGGGSGPFTSLADDFLQIGDFYFQGIYGATESWTQGIGANGYATGGAAADTLVLIRGLPATAAQAIDTSMVDAAGNLIHGDYWVKNHNSANNGEAGTVVYLQGDSFDGRPDGLRMIWSSMLNLGFLPNEAELSRSSGVVLEGTATSTYHNHTTLGVPDNYLLQGTFVQADLPSKYGTIYNTKTDMPNFAFPAERGHFRQYDTTADACLTSAVGGGVSQQNTAGACQAAVTIGSAGSNTTSFGGAGLNGTWEFWDTNGPNPVTTTKQLMIDNAVNAAGIDPPLKYRLIFSHLYQGFPAGDGIKPVSLNPQFAMSAALGCALFPKSTNCAAASVNNLACPDGTHCVQGQLNCVSCVGNGVVLGAPVALSRGACNTFASCATSDVGGLLYDVFNAAGGCVPLLKDTCYPDGDPHIACLDACWTTCVSNCNPISSYPPLGVAPNNCQSGQSAASVAQCGSDCASRCNATDPAHDNCGANSANVISDFRESCGTGIGGVDHSTPVIVGPPPLALNEAYLKNPTNVAAGTISGACRPTVAYVGAADGMLHAIYLDNGNLGVGCADTCASGGKFVPGQELWAFVPNQQLPLLSTNGNCQESLAVDGVPTVKDIFADLGDGRGPQWHTVLTETEGVGGNHVFALDVTDPLAPLRASDTANCQAANQSTASLAQARVILWENGDPLDSAEYRPERSASGVVSWDYNGFHGTEYSDDITHEGPGFPSVGLVSPPTAASLGGPGHFNHYLGESSQVFMGQLLGAGSQENITYVSAQNNQTDGYGRPIVLPSCAANCNPKDFSNPTAPGSTLGPQGEVVYAFDSASGIPRSQSNNLGGTVTNVIEHYTELYFTSGGLEGFRSGGNNDIPAPAVGVSLSNRPETELVVVPDLDGQVWGLFPGTLAPYRSLLNSGTPAAYPLFDLQRYSGSLPGGSLYTCGAPAAPAVLTAQGGALVQEAPFANPAAFIPPGTCQSVNDPVLLLATGGVDWGSAASVIVALDVAPTNSAIEACTDVLTCPVAVLANDSAASPLPQQGTAPPNCTPLEVATCPTHDSNGNPIAYDPTASTCVGRVFGQPLVVGQDVLFATSTGSLTGVGSSLAQQQGDGRIQALGSSSCNATSINSGLAANGCGICASGEQSTDLALKVGKVASGLAASSPDGAGETHVFSASTTGLGSLNIKVTPAAQPSYQKVVLQQYWLRRTQRTLK